MEESGRDAQLKQELTAIDHTGIAVYNTNDAVRLYCDVLGLVEGPKRLHAGEGIHITFLEGSGGRIELLEPTEAESAISRFLAKHGEGIHHVCFRVGNVKETADRMTAAGFQVIDERPRTGLGGETLVFIHPKSTNGVLIELLEPAIGG